MGEIMRWRLARPAQRLVPDPATTLNLPNPFQIAPIIQGAQALNQPTIQQAIASYQKILSNPTTLRQYLNTANVAGTPVNARLTANVFNLFVGLWKLDQWLAANNPVPPAYPPYSEPTVAALTQQVNVLLGQPLPAEWATLGQIISDIYYVALILSAWGVSFSLTEVLGVLTRWLLVIGLVNDLQVNPSPIQTPDDIYNDLRWRTPVLPDIVSLVLLIIRTRNQAVLVRRPAFADLYVTREEWDHYESAEIASITNIMARELMSRTHVLINQTQVTTTIDTSTTQVKEQDTTNTDTTQLQQQASSDISIAAHVDGQVDTSGNYGGTQVNTHLGGSLDYSNASSTSKSVTQSHETVSRAVSKIEQTTRQIRTVSTLTREKDSEQHKLDNSASDAAVVGIYRWVDQIQNVELDRYPNRFLMEFEIPEPGAWLRWLQNKNAGSGMINQPPVPFTLDGSQVKPPDPTANPPYLGNTLTAKQITGDNYAMLAARYLVAGTSAPPGPLTVSVNLGAAKDVSAPAPRIGAGDQSDTTVAIPNGYVAVSGVDANGNPINGWTASLMYATGGFHDGQGLGNDCHIDVAVGAGAPIRSAPANAAQDPGTAIQTHGDVFRDQIHGAVGPISQGNVPVALQGINLTGFEVNVEIQCVPLPQTYEQWQNDTYAVILSGYTAQLQAYNDEKAGQSVQQTNPVDTNSPDQNARTITQELKRQVVEMLTGTRFTGLNAISWALQGTLTTQPTTILATAARVAPEIQFMEQAFEWETLTYICYPYYWADSSRWPDLAVIEGNDTNFADFLRAGSARVVVAARPGFEDQVNFFVQYGILWGGGPMPAPGDPDYLSVADEIKAMQQRPIDVTVIDTWQVRLPTALIWLQNEDPEGQLPSNPSKTIDVIPNIVSLSPNSGAVGDSVTIAGKNFGDIEGVSTVTFNNNITATPTSWSATTIEVTVPVGATTGNVVVTANGMASNGVSFTVN
jgi:hypothetical protein